MSNSEVVLRVEGLEAQVRRLRLLVGLLLIALFTVPITGWVGTAEPEVLRAGGLVIVDEEGRERIVLGAPIPEPEGRRISPATGLVINDENGAERFGVGLLETGSVVLGLDAPPDPRAGNRERITLSANSSGGAELRFLNRQSYVAAHMSLFEDDDVALFFTRRGEDGTTVHRISAEGDTVVVHPPR